MKSFFFGGSNQPFPHLNHRTPSAGRACDVSSATETAESATVHGAWRGNGEVAGSIFHGQWISMDDNITVDHCHIIHNGYHLVMTNIAMENYHSLIGKPSINGPSIPWLC